MRYLFVFLVFWTLPVIADSPVSGFATGQPLLEKNPETTVAVTALNPANLTADWWRYFEVEPSILKDRINAADRYLNEALQELPEDEKSGAKARIDRITENLPTLLELRKKTGPEALISRPLQKTYKLRQWLDIVHKRRTLQAEVQSENENLLRDEKRYNAARQSLDSLTAAYLALPDQSRNKAVQGLAIMALWSELAINNERLRLQKAALSLHNEQLKQLVKEGEAIPDRLFINADDLQQLKQEIEVAERELGAARESSSQLEASRFPGALKPMKVRPGPCF